MNPKIRALIWEELRTGGVIAGWCLAVGSICLLSARLTEGWKDMDWNYVSPVALSLSILPLLLLALLLLYRTGNAGNLTGGFSGRILLLPVETWKLAGLALFLRATLLGAATLATILVCRALFEGNGPAWVLVALLPGFFMLLQSLDWLRRPNPLFAALGLLPVGLAVASVLLSESFRKGGLDTPFLSGTAGLGTLLLTGAIAYFFSLFAVARSRRGSRVKIALRVSLPEAMPIPGWRIERGFSSPRWALLWNFLSKDGYVLPLFALVIGAFAALGFSIWQHYAEKDGVSWLTLIDWGVWPVFALTAMVWGGLRGGAGIQRGIRPVLTEYLYPISAAEMAVTRLWGYGIVLGITWAIAVTLSNLGFFLGDHGLSWRIWTESLAAGESSLRELLAGRLLLPMMILLGVWTLTALRTRLVAWLLGLTMLYTATFATAQTCFHDKNPDWILLIPISITLAVTMALIVWTIRGCKKANWLGACWAVPYGLAICLGAAVENLQNTLPWFPVAFIVVVTFSAVLWSWQRGIMPLRHVVGCALVWLAIVLFAFPFGYWHLSGIDRSSLFYVTMLGALVVLPYPALLLDLHRRRHHDDTPADAKDHGNPRGWGLSSPVAGAGYVVLALLLAALAWLRWPATPAYIDTLRAQGQPATDADLARYYGPLPESENAAPRYLAVVKEKVALNQRWNVWVAEKRKNSNDTERDLIFGPDNQFSDGLVALTPGEPLWTVSWETARVHHEMVSAPATDALAEVAALKRPRSHYPIDLGSGPAVSLPHLSQLRDLARAQGFEVWMAAMEDRPEDALRTILAMAPLAESLREEPILISQLVRIAIHGIMTSSIEQSLNRTEFTDAQLAELQHYLSTVLPPVNEHGLIQQGMVGERVFATSHVDAAVWADSVDQRTTMLAQSWFMSFSRTILIRCLAEMEKNTGNATTRLIDEIAEASNPQFTLALILLPALDRARDAEFRCRVSIDMAATACAVERYRLANGALPPTLDALVPAFLEKVPVDPFRDDGGPVSYRVTEDGGYALYSWAQNRRDDGGIHRIPMEKKGNDWSNGDWIFSVAPLSFRNGPQLTDVPPVDEDEAAAAPGRHRMGRGGA